MCIRGKIKKIASGAQQGMIFLCHVFRMLKNSAALSKHVNLLEEEQRVDLVEYKKSVF